MPPDHLVLFFDEVEQGFTINATRVGERFVEPVPRFTVETTGGEILTAKLPIRGRLLRNLHHRQAVLPHEFVIDALDPDLTTALGSVVEGSVLGQRLTGLVVMVDDEDVVVDLRALAVGMGDDETVRVGMHPLRQFVAEVIGSLNVVRVVTVELRAEGLPVREHLHFPPVLHRERVRTRREGPRRTRYVRSERDRAVISLTSDVPFGVHRRPARCIEARAHEAVRSPRSWRTSRSRLTSSRPSDPKRTGSPARARRSRSFTLTANGRICLARTTASSETDAEVASSETRAATAASTSSVRRASSASRTTALTHADTVTPCRRARRRTAASVASSHRTSR